MDNPKITSFDDAGADTALFGDILTRRNTMTGKLKVGLLGCGYYEYWRMYPPLRETVAQDLEGARERLAKRFDLFYPGMVDTLDKADAAGEAMAAEGVEVVVVMEGTYLPDFITTRALDRLRDPLVILFNSQTGDNLNPTDNYPATMRNSALIGISQLTGSFRKMGRPYEVVVGEIGDEAAYDEVERIVNAHKIVRKLRNYTVGVLGHVFRGMYDLEFDKAKVRGALGPEAMTIQAEHLVSLWRDIPDSEADAAARKLMARFKARNVRQEDVRASLKLGLAMRKLCQKYKLDGLCFLGQHYIEKMTGAPARMGASMLIEEDRLMVACEGDIAGLVMMEMSRDLSGKIPFQAEWGQFDIKHNALFLLGHGIASPELARSDAHVTLTRSPEEWGFEGSGLNYEFILGPGPVTMGHFLHAEDGWRMLISEGEALDFPCLPCDEIHAMVKVESPVKDYVREVLRHGAAHHLIVTPGHFGASLEKVAERMGINALVIK